MALGYLQSKYESVPGNEVNTPTLSTKEIFFPLITSTPDLAPSPMSRDDELRNLDEPLPVIPETYDPTWDYTSRMYPDLLGFFMKALMGPPTTVQGNGTIKDPDEVIVPTGAYRHVWTTPPTGIVPQTMQLIYSYKDQGVFYKIKGAATEKVSISSPATGGVQLAANGPGLFMQRTTDPALSPSYQAAAIRPWTRSNLSVTWQSGSSADANDFTVDMENPVESVRSLGTSSRYADLMERSDDLFTVSGTINFRTLDQDDYDALKNSAGFEAKARWVQGTEDSQITGSYPYKFFIVMSNCQYNGGSMDALSNTRHHGASFNWKASNNGANAATITLVNSTSSYA